MLSLAIALVSYPTTPSSTLSRMREGAVIVSAILAVVFLYWTLDYIRRRSGR